MNADFDRDELIQLVDRLATGTIEPAEHERLTHLLTAHPEARKVYFAFMDIDLGLRDMAVACSAQVPPPVGLGLPPSASQTSASPKPFTRFFGYAVTAAVAALATAVTLFLLIREPEQPREMPSTPLLSRDQPPSEHQLSPTQPPADCVATLLFADECRWKTGGFAPVEGQRLSIGELHLEEGLALLRFDGGAIAVIAGNTNVDLESRGSVRLHYGRLTARASDEAIGFTVRTPARNVVDMGTEFAVEVGRSGTTEVHVLDGAVELRDPTTNAESGQLLRSGHAVRFDKARAMKPTPIAVSTKRLDQILQEAKPKPREDLLVVYEGFQYDVGTLPLVHASGGYGWRGPWRCPRNKSESTRDMQIAFQKLRVPWPILGGRAGMLEMAPGNKLLERPLEEPVNLASDRVYYLSIMMREDVDAKEGTARKRNESARLTLRSSEDYWGDRVCFGLPKHRTPHIELADYNRFTGRQVSGGQTMIWVAKIAAQQRGEDEIFFRVYQEGESLDIFEPADWSITSRGFRSDAKLDLLSLASRGKTRRWFDEVRIGTRWRAVVPIAKPTKVAAQQGPSPVADTENSIDPKQ